MPIPAESISHFQVTSFISFLLLVPSLLAPSLFCSLLFRVFFCRTVETDCSLNRSVIRRNEMAESRLRGSQCARKVTISSSLARHTHKTDVDEWQLQQLRFVLFLFDPSLCPVGRNCLPWLCLLLVSPLIFILFFHLFTTSPQTHHPTLSLSSRPAHDDPPPPVFPFYFLFFLPLTTS